MQIGVEQLSSLGRDVAPPFEIALADGVCAVTEIHRLLPGRRLAGRGRHRGRDVLRQSCSSARGARRACERDRREARSCCVPSGVDTPGCCCWRQPSPHRTGRIRVDVRVPGAGATDRNRPECPEVGEFVRPWRWKRWRACMSRGAVHRDANLDNFMVGRRAALRCRWRRRAADMPAKH